MVRAFAFKLVFFSLVQAVPFNEWDAGLQVHIPPFEVDNLSIPIVGMFELNVTGGSLHYYRDSYG